jgi:hypothetical protein
VEQNVTDAVEIEVPIHPIKNSTTEQQRQNNLDKFS